MPSPAGLGRCDASSYHSEMKVYIFDHPAVSRRGSRRPDRVRMLERASTSGRGIGVRWRPRRPGPVIQRLGATAAAAAGRARSSSISRIPDASTYSVPMTTHSWRTGLDTGHGVRMNLDLEMLDPMSPIWKTASRRTGVCPEIRRSAACLHRRWILQHPEPCSSGSRPRSWSGSSPGSPATNGIPLSIRNGRRLSARLRRSQGVPLNIPGHCGFWCFRPAAGALIRLFGLNSNSDLCDEAPAETGARRLRRGGSDRRAGAPRR